jgi:hypothetical protein
LSVVRGATVLRAGVEYEAVSSEQLDEVVFANPAVANSAIAEGKSLQQDV